MLPSIYWIANDHHVWPWDPAWYGEVSVDLWFKLGRRLSKWAPAMLTAFGSKAPGIAWLGQFFVPLGRAIGSVETGLLCSVLAAQIGSLIFAWRIGEEFAPGRRLLACVYVFVFAGAPLFVAMSHQYFVEPLQLFGVTYFYFLAATGHRMRRMTLLGNLLLATSIALLAKMTSPIYCLLPGLVATWALFQKQKPGCEPSSKGVYWRWSLLFAGVLLCVACAIWYTRNLPALRETLQRQTSLEFTSYYGNPGTFLEKFSYWFHALQWNFQLPWVIVGQLILAGAGAALARIRGSASVGSPRPGGEWRFDLLTICSVVHILAVLSLCSLNYNEENRYLLPLLPAIAMANLWIINKIRQPWILAGVITLLVSQWIAVCSQALGWTHLDQKICAYWLFPLDGNRKPAEEIARLVHDTSNLAGKSRMNLVGVDFSWLNGATLSFFAAKEALETRRRYYYTSLGFAAKNLDHAWKRLNEIQPGYFISVEESAQPASPDSFNVISLSALRRIRDDPDYVLEPFNSHMGVVVFRRKAENSPSATGTRAQ